MPTLYGTGNKTAFRSAVVVVQEMGMVFWHVNCSHLAVLTLDHHEVRYEH